jgi:hypothetical protein
MSAPLHPVRWPVPEHLRPKPRVSRLPQDPGEPVECLVDIWAGGGQPSCGWVGGETDIIPLDVAVAPPVAGEP